MVILLNIKDNISTVCNAKNVFMFNDNIYIPSKKQDDILSIFLDYTLENKLEFNEDKNHFYLIMFYQV